MSTEQRMLKQEKKLYLAWNLLSAAYEALNRAALIEPGQENNPEAIEIADNAIDNAVMVQITLDQLVSNNQLDKASDPYYAIPMCEWLTEVLE